MSRLLIRGGNRLQGEVTIQGAKNSVLPILAATILTGGSVVLRRCPRLRDVEASIRILQALGCKAGWRGDVLEVDTAGMTGCDVPDALMREMRSSVIFLGGDPGPVRGGKPHQPRRLRIRSPAHRPAPLRPPGTWGGDRRYRRHPALQGGKADGAGDRAGVPLCGGHGKSDAGGLRRGGRHGAFQRRQRTGN